MKKADDIRKLLQKYVSGNCTREEHEQVFICLKTPEGIKQLQKIMDAEALKVLNSTAKVNPGITKEIYARLSVRIRSSKSNKNV